MVDFLLDSDSDVDVGLAPPCASTNTGGQRNYTPVRVRPHSQPKARPSPAEPIPVEARLRTRRHVGRRKERRWDNDRLLGTGQHNRVGLPTDTVDVGELEELAGKLQIEWTSNFEPLTTSKGAELRDQFISCDQQFQVQNTQQPGLHRHVKSEAERRFIAVDKKLRHHLVTSGTRPKFAQFVSHLENFLMLLFTQPPPQSEQHDDDDNLDALFEKLKPSLLLPASDGSISEASDGPSAQESTKRAVRYRYRGETQVVEMCFKSGVYRLLAHGTCEFHGLHSKSVTDDHGRRVMTISSAAGKDVYLKTTAQVDTGRGRCLTVSLSDFLVNEHR